MLMQGLFLPVLLLSAIPARTQTDRTARRLPVNSAQTVFDNIFGLPPGDTAYFFRVNLSGDNFITIRFRQLGAWENGAVRDVVDIARLGWEQLRDSLRGNATSRRIALSVPPSNYPVLTAYREWGTDERIMMLGGDGPRPVRIAYDTISVLRAYKNTSGDTAVHRNVLYTFLLKDLDQIRDLAGDTALIGDISRSFDSVLDVRRRRWKAPNAAIHGLGLDYNTVIGKKKPKIDRWYENAWYKHFDYTIDLGTSFTAGQLGTYSSFRLAYNIASDRPGSYGYVALSWSALVFLREEAGQLEDKSLGFMNVEIGSVIGGQLSGLPVYRTGVGMGYCVARKNASPFDFKYRLFFSYGVTKSITIMPDYYIIPKKDRIRGDEGLGAGGITVSVRLF